MPQIEYFNLCNLSSAQKQQDKIRTIRKNTENDLLEFWKGKENVN